MYFSLRFGKALSLSPIGVKNDSISEIRNGFEFCARNLIYEKTYRTRIFMAYLVRRRRSLYNIIFKMSLDSVRGVPTFFRRCEHSCQFVKTSYLLDVRIYSPKCDKAYLVACMNSDFIIRYSI